MENINIKTCVHCKSNVNKYYMNRHQQTNKCKNIKFLKNSKQPYDKIMEEEYELLQELEFKEYEEKHKNNVCNYDSHSLSQSIFGGK